VVASEGGEEALRLAREIAPDAITLDVMMPGMDGWAVLGALKADAATADIPVVVVTAKDLTPEERQRLNGQAERILAKGALGPQALLAEVRGLVAASLARRRTAPRPDDRLPSENRLRPENQ